MRDPRLDRLAEVLVRYCTSVGQGDLVTIVGEPDCMTAVEALFEAVLRAGGIRASPALREPIHADNELFHKDGRFLFSGWPGE